MVSFIPLARRGAVTWFFVAGLYLAWASPAVAALLSGAYHTLPGATVEERGDRVPNGGRVVPLSASLVFDLKATPPLLTTFLADAVLEGGEPFALTVRSSTGAALTNGLHRFSGDYLRDLHPAGTQYLFDWTFSAAHDGSVAWDGIIGWAGGHLWYVTISNLALAPEARLSLSRAGDASTRLTWAGRFAAYVLEHSPSLTATNWSSVTNAVTTSGDLLSVTVDIVAAPRFYRLRKP
jgi:hypothetical protein